MSYRSLFVMLALLACSPGDSGGRVVSVERSVGSLVEQGECLQVIREDSAHPVRARLAAPVGQSWFDGDTLPSLVACPPCELRITLPEVDPGARLDIALGFDRGAYAPDIAGGVRFEVELDGVLVHAVERPAGPNVPRLERAWARVELSVASGAILVLRTTGVELSGAGVPAVFGNLQLHVPMEVTRTPSSVARPNVLLIVVDTLRADALGTYGNREALTPNIDALAERGQTYETAYSPAPWTLPSTASILTGRPVAWHGLRGPGAAYLADGQRTIAEVFQDAGFKTGAFTCNPLVSRSRNMDQGFESFTEYPWASTREVLPDILDWLDRTGDDRFFLYLHWIDPHSPEDPEPDLFERFGSPSREPVMGKARIKRMARALALGGVVDRGLLARFVERERAFYNAEVASADRALGSLIAALEQRGLLERTLIAFTSDHGEEWFEHGQVGHGGQLFPESIRVPLILAGPGLDRGERVTGAADLCALGPTLLGLSGVPVPPGAQVLGVPGPIQVETSIGIRFEGPEGTSYTDRRVLGLIDGGMYFLWHPSQGGAGERWSLYDLAQDPGATRDLASGSRDALEGYRSAIQRHLERAGPAPLAAEDVRAEREALKAHGYLGGEDD
jgi:arylsulfatase A-like enzyme